MRSSYISFRGEELLPEWAATFVRELSRGGAETPGDLLSPISLIDEILMIVAGMRNGREAPKRADRQSLRDDLMLSLDQLGPNVNALYGVPLGDYRKHAGQLDSKLGSLADAIALQTLSAVLKNELSSPDGRRAALADAETAFETGATVETCQFRLLYLRTTLTAAGHDWAERAKLVLEAYADRRAAVVAAGGDSPTEVKDWIESVGQTLEQRRSLAADLVAAAPEYGTAFVWCVFADAHLDGFFLERGPLQFYDGRIWEFARDGNWAGPSGWAQPAELALPEASRFLDRLPERDYVVVRARIDNVRSSQAAARGRDLVRAAVELTGWASDWRLIEGAAVFTNQWFGTTGFLDRRTIPPFVNPRLDPVGRQLQLLDGHILSRLSTGDEAAWDLVDDIRWRRSARDADTRDQRIVLDVALLERLLTPASTTGGGWHDTADHYLRLLHALDEIHEFVQTAGYGAYSHYGWISDTPLPLARPVVEQSGHGAITIHGDRIVEQVDDLLAVTPTSTMEARMLREIKERLSDGPSAYVWFNKCERRFKRLLARSRRQRNAATHGTRTVEAVIDSVEPFLAHLIGRLVGAWQKSVQDGVDLKQQLESYRVIWERHKDALAKGGDPVTELFPEPPSRPLR